VGEWRDGTGRIVQDESQRTEALAALQRKYGWQFSSIVCVAFIGTALC
jgi:hypothetical protein